MERAQEGEAVLLFMDASHFVMGCDFPGCIYSRARRFVKTWSGRRRYNVPGAIDFVSKRVCTIANDSYITATEVCEMLRKLRAQFAGKEIHPVLDNARYQKCRIVLELASSLDIHLVYIPPYSPNLNLIERLWKFVKGELRSKYYDDFSLFCKKIDSVINSSSKKNKCAIERLIGEKVQLFDHLALFSDNSHSCLTPAV